jgi:hypothetical protein
VLLLKGRVSARLRVEFDQIKSVVVWGPQGSCLYVWRGGVGGTVVMWIVFYYVEVVVFMGREVSLV